MKKEICIKSTLFNWKFPLKKFKKEKLKKKIEERKKTVKECIS